MVGWFMYNLHNKVTEDPSILPGSRRLNAEYLTIVKLYLIFGCMMENDSGDSALYNESNFISIS